MLLLLRGPLLRQERRRWLRGPPMLLLLLPRRMPVLLLPPRKALRMRSWRCGGGEEGEEEGGRSKAEMGRAWAVSQATSISEVYSISVSRTYMGESLPESLHGLGEPGHDPRVVSHWRPNVDMVLTSGYSKGLEMRTWMCGGGEEGGEEGGSFRVL